MNDPHLSQAERVAHFRRLVQLAYADKNLEDAELAVMQAAAKRWGIHSVDVHEALNTQDVESGTLPTRRELLADMLYDLVEICMIDGDFRQAEKELLSRMAKSLGFDVSGIDQVKDAILRGNREGQPEDAIRATARKQLLA